MIVDTARLTWFLSAVDLTGMARSQTNLCNKRSFPVKLVHTSMRSGCAIAINAAYESVVPFRFTLRYIGLYMRSELTPCIIFYYIKLTFIAAIVCHDLDDIKYGGVKLSSKHYGSRAQYYCNKGYKLYGDEYRNCLYTGYWGGKAPVCKRKCSLKTK